MYRKNIRNISRTTSHHLKLTILVNAAAACPCTSGWGKNMCQQKEYEGLELCPHSFHNEFQHSKPSNQQLEIPQQNDFFRSNLELSTTFVTES
jgi:hypothetical protein